MLKKIKHEGGEWRDVDRYLTEYGVVEFSHGMCPNCYQENSGGNAKALEEKRREPVKCILHTGEYSIIV